jgi:ATP-binding cassette subfamily B protein
MTPGLRDVLSFAWRHWRRRPYVLIVLAIGIGGAILAEIFGPVFIGRLIDALTAEDLSAAILALASVLAMRFLFVAFHNGGDYVWCHLAVGIMRQICADAFARVQRYSSEWHANTFAGSTVRKITRGYNAFDTLGDSIYFHLLPSALVVLGVIATMAVQWPEMAALFGAGTLLYGVVSVLLAVGYFAPLRRRAVVVDTELGGALADGLTCNALVKASGTETREDSRLGRLLAGWRETHRRCWKAAVDTAVVQSLTMIMVQGLLLAASLWLWRQGRASAGDVAYVFTSFMLVNGYLRDVGQHIRVAQQAVNDIEDVVVYAMTPPEIVDAPAAPELVVGDGGIRFERVRFNYPKSNRAVFGDLSLDIRPGETGAPDGHSGSGTSTFVQLIQRLYDLDGGQILNDGQAIADDSLASLRQAVALVPQEPILFHRTLAENIAYDRPEADLQAIEAAGRLAEAASFIQDLPEGYDTLVGERGVKLSGGERQRVAIARALLADRQILVLDEATSSLDSISELAIQKALARLMEDRTTIVIAHRLSTIRQVDRILVFDRGRIVEEGTHDALVDRPGGQYRRLYETQAEGFLPKLAV